MPLDISGIIHEFARPVTKIIKKHEVFSGEDDSTVIMNEAIKWEIKIVSRTIHEANLRVKFSRNAKDRRPYFLFVSKRITLVRNKSAYEKIIVTFDEDDIKKFRETYFLHGFYMISLLTRLNLEINSNPS
jgi:hypothetical protein